MTIPDISHDENIFPDSHSFVPERWLNDPKAPDGVPLERYMVSFGRGTRSCLGINLAHIEMYLTLGMMFRNYKFEMHDTDVSDVEMGHDFFIPVTKLDRQGVRAFVVTTDD
jgi:cytochrome P450